MKIENRSVQSLIPYARNARTHSDAQVAQIAASIREFGWSNPILVDGANGIIAGHGRLLAARKLGMTEVPVIELTHLSKTQVRALIIADNKLAMNAGWDEALLASELGELKDLGFELDTIGFDGDIFGKDESGDKKVTMKPYESSTVNDEFWITIKGPLYNQAESLRILKEAMKDLGGVSVNIGTTQIE